MKHRYRIIQRGSRGGACYCVDTATGRRTSLGTADRDAAEQIVLAKNQALRQPSLNLQIAKAYLAGSDSGSATRTWGAALEILIETKLGETRRRWLTAAKDRAFAPLLPRVLTETRAEELLAVLRRGTVSTNVHLRKLHNFCHEMGWLPWPVLPRRQWPPVRYQDKRAITAWEHARIVAREPDRERRLFYELLWELGGAQSDVACLRAEDVSRPQRLVSYQRHKTGSLARLHYGERLAALLGELPAGGPLFPRLAAMHEKHRAKEFKRRCRGLGIQGVTLHSYRYAWAERAKAAGYPERFAQEALGHNSKAVHRAYARHAEVRLPSLEEYEARTRVVAFPSPAPASGTEAPCQGSPDDRMNMMR
ncbi:MAG TPA: tyrosine-type recombinase/integrase [Verrucomicrobiota bacterium]|nr:tyrosine-type recombinase/integrase [Verrucomicrobiota bacterium]